MPCFGQSFQLGMLYNCRSHHFVLGPKLWEPDILKIASMSRASTQSNFTCKVFTGDRLEEKMASLGVESSLKLSLMTGLVSPSCIGNFIFDQKSSNKKARVTLKYESTSKFDTLSLDQIKRELHRDISEEMTATHFVSGIEYGTQAVFVFDQDVDDKEMYIDVEDDLKLTIDSLSRVPAKESGSFFTDEQDDEKRKKIKCSFYGNQTTFKNSMSYEDAVKAYRALKTNKDSQVDEVPKRAWLHPLSSLDTAMLRPVREVSAHVTDALLNIIESFNEFETRVSDLLKSNVCSIFSSLQNQISRCEKAASEYRKNLLTRLSILLPVVRSGDEEEKLINDVLDEVASSPFHQTYLSTWISRKEKEMKVLSTYLEYFKDIQLVLSQEDLDNVVNSSKYDRVVCFSLLTTSTQDDLVEQLYDFLRTGSWEQECLAAQHWSENPEVVNDIKCKARTFRGFAKENESDERTKFIFTNVHKSTGVKVVAVQMYEGGHTTDFEPPGRPGKPYETKKSDSSITLEWDESPYGMCSVQKYTVHFRPAASHSSTEYGGEWKSLQTRAESDNIITVNGLKAKTAYLFKVNSETKAGRSAISDSSDIIVTEKCPNHPAEFMLSSSKKITSESPLIYKLSTKVVMEQEDSMIARQRFGWPECPATMVTEKVLMVVGATGAGKTTLINGMVNYILGVEWEDNFRFKLIVEDAGISQANSQTKNITAYTFYPVEGSTVPYIFTIIDTPGFGDTEGVVRDKAITSQIKEFFSIPPPNGIDHLDGIGFVTQASLARLTPTQEYIFNSVLSIFGKDVSKNIFLMITSADYQYPPVMNAIEKANIPYEKYFKFNNSALFAKNAESKENFNEILWKMGFDSFRSFFAKFAKSESVSLQLTREVLKEREQLQTLLEGLNSQITIGLNKIEEMRQEELALQQHEKEIETNKEFSYRVDVTQPRHIDLTGTGKYTTTCLHCNFTCHKDCAYSDDSMKALCCSMGPDGNCTVCTMHCHWSEHRNLPYLIEYESVTETRTSDDLKKKYEKAVSGKSKLEVMIAELESSLQTVHLRIMDMICRAKEILSRLREIALKPDPLTHLQHLQVLIQSEKNAAKSGWKQRVQYYEEARLQAEILSKVEDAKAAEKEIQERARKGDSWFRKFMFWRRRR